MHRLLAEVQQLGIRKEAGRERLRQLRALIVEHLRHEDAEFYPALQRNAATQELAHTYANEMRQLSAEILGFFDTWQHGGDTLAFGRHYGRLLGLLNRRWAGEEIRLYPAYDQHCRRSDAA
ncbi:hemerythrin domain-containing protein [Rhodanobacter denitrificans]|nr:hemerythrin domain-containing protein [Rhodanobacter denitrificans]